MNRKYEETETENTKVRLTITPQRVSLKFIPNLTEEEKAFLKTFSKRIADNIPEAFINNSIRGNWELDNLGYLRMYDSSRKHGVTFKASELGLE